ncbi:hypothetical protein U9M48_014339 [Paspalum notatum var. saurae]|uniref:Uncharacterized protein n=1 Tax=Paspalum notatum var. saurae TaxID=547442 RepID=A0AAQ3WKL2_PASNO
MEWINEQLTKKEAMRIGLAQMVTQEITSSVNLVGWYYVLISIHHLSSEVLDPMIDHTIYQKQNIHTYEVALHSSFKTCSEFRLMGNNAVETYLELVTSPGQFISCSAVGIGINLLGGVLIQTQYRQTPKLLKVPVSHYREEPFRSPSMNQISWLRRSPVASVSDQL